KLRKEWKELAEKEAKLQEEYDQLSEEQQYAKHGELDQAKKLTEDAMLNMTKLVGGLIAVDDLHPVMAAYEKAYGIAREITKLDDQLQDAQVTQADAAFALKKGKGTQAKVDAATAKV